MSSTKKFCKNYVQSLQRIDQNIILHYCQFGFYILVTFNLVSIINLLIEKITWTKLKTIKICGPN